MGCGLDITAYSYAVVGALEISFVPRPEWFDSTRCYHFKELLMQKYAWIANLAVAVVCYGEMQVLKIIKDADFWATCRTHCRFYGYDRGNVRDSECYCERKQEQIYDKRIILPSKVIKTKLSATPVSEPEVKYSPSWGVMPEPDLSWMDSN